jgi:hypothetical protein
MKGKTTMLWFYVGFFFGGAFFANSLPHLFNGISGRAFQTPFAKPPGKGLSSSTVNVLWGFLNLLAAYLLIVWEGSFNLRNVPQIATAGAGFLLMALVSALGFGRYHGGNNVN